MSTQQLAAIGIFATATQAEASVNILIAKGFSSAEISVLLPEQANTQSASEQPDGQSAPQHRTSKTTATTAIGATAGSALFGALAVVAGAGALAIPGIGPLIAAGPLVAGLAGLGIGGAVGGLSGALVGMGLQEDEAKRYVSYIGEGRTLLVVHCATPEDVLKAKDLLTSAGAASVASGGERLA
jgi:hypothetical protein